MTTPNKKVTDFFKVQKTIQKHKDIVSHSKPDIPKEITLAIIGYREFTDEPIFENHMNEWMKENGGYPNKVTSGEAKGADTLAKHWAYRNKITYIGKPPINYDFLGRNKKIIEEATHVIAFVNKKSKGTWHAVNLAKRKGIPVKLVYI